MANSFSSASFAAYWSRRMQRTAYRQAVYVAIVSMEEYATLTKGQTVHRPYRSTLYARTYTRGTAVTIRDLTDTDESLTVNVSKVVPFYVDDLDALQHNYRVLNEYADDAATVLTNFIDGDVLGEYANATSKVDDVEINGGTAGNGYTLTTANILKMFTEAKKKLQKQNLPGGLTNLVGIISPEVESVLLNFFANRESALGDTTGVNGNIGSYMGFKLHVSNSLTFSARLVTSTIPTAGDTITINGVVATARADGSAVSSGDFSIQATAALATAQLVALLNNTTGYAATEGAVDTYFEFTAADRDLLIGMTATDGTTYIDIKFEGVGLVAVSETLTPAADVWTGALQIQHQLFGKAGSIDLVIQAKPKVEVKEVPDKLGKNVLPYTLYGMKTFAEGARALVDVRVRADSGQGVF
jgi:hypothetical protein